MPAPRRPGTVVHLTSTSIAFWEQKTLSGLVQFLLVLERWYVLRKSHVEMVLVQYVNQELGILQCSGSEELTVPLLVPARVVSVEIPCPD